MPILIKFSKFFTRFVHIRYFQHIFLQRGSPILSVPPSGPSQTLSSLQKIFVISQYSHPIRLNPTNKLFSSQEIRSLKKKYRIREICMQDAVDIANHKFPVTRINVMFNFILHTILKLAPTRIVLSLFNNIKRITPKQVLKSSL